MEIERRFIVSGFPDQKPVYTAQIEQGYLCIETVEARIRKTVDHNKTSYKIGFKSDGTLSRQEVEFEIEPKYYEALKALLEGPMIKKDYRVYEMDDQKLEVCQVDAGTPDSYYYAEIEFDNEPQALAYDSSSLPCLIKEVTYDKSYNMKNFWRKTRRSE